MRKSVIELFTPVWVNGKTATEIRPNYEVLDWTARVLCLTSLELYLSSGKFMRNPLFFSKRSAFRFTIYFSVSLENVFECNPIIFCQVWITKIWDFLFYTVGPPMRPWHSVNKILIVDPDTDPWCTDTESLLYQTYHQVWSGTAGGIWDQSKQRHVSTVHCPLQTEDLSCLRSQNLMEVYLSAWSGWK